MKESTNTPAWPGLIGDPQNFKPKERLLWYVERFTKNPLRCLRISESAEILGVDRKTIRRGLQEMAELFHVKLVFHEDHDLVTLDDKRGFDWIDFGRAFPFDDVFLFFLKIWDSTSLVPVDRGLLAGVRQKLQDVVSKRVEDLVNRIVFHPKLRHEVDSSDLPHLLEAFIDDHRVGFVYESMRNAATSELEGDPINLVRYNDDWYLAMDVGDSEAELRLFRWSRISQFKVLDEKCRHRVSPAAVSTAIDHTYGIFLSNPDQAQTVTLAFRGEALHYVESFSFAGELTRRFTNLPSKEPTVEVDVCVYGDSELISDALGWGADCEVMGPPETRQRWLTKVGELWRCFGV